MAVVIRGGIDVVVRLQEKLSNNAPGPDNTTVQIDNPSFALDAGDAGNAAYILPGGEVHLEIASLLLSNWQPNQRFRLTLTPIDPGLC